MDATSFFLVSHFEFNAHPKDPESKSEITFSTNNSIFKEKDFLKKNLDIYFSARKTEVCRENRCCQQIVNNMGGTVEAQALCLNVILASGTL